MSLLLLKHQCRLISCRDYQTFHLYNIVINFRKVHSFESKAKGCNLVKYTSIAIRLQQSPIFQFCCIEGLHQKLFLACFNKTIGSRYNLLNPVLIAIPSSDIYDKKVAFFKISDPPLNDKS